MPLPTILSGNVASALGGAFEVANSCRFNDGDNAYMHKTPSGAGNQDVWTFSTWFKRSGLAKEQALFVAGSDSSNATLIWFRNDDILEFSIYNSGTRNGRVQTSVKYRDVSAWYHLCVSYNSADGTATDRMKIYINGARVTDVATPTNPSSGQDSLVNHTSKHSVGSDGAIGFITGAGDFDGYMAETVLLDGTAATPTSFGEYDEDSPTIWKPIDVSGLTFGTNGFYLDYEDSANLGNDANGGTDFTEVNLAAADQAVDTPTNNFCTLNPLFSVAKSSSANYPPTYSEGNCKIVQSDNDTRIYSCNTIAMPPKGKWYMEVKFLSVNVCYAGIIDMDKVGAAAQGNVDLSSSGTTGYNQVVYQTNYIYAGTSTSYGDDLSTNDIMGLAWDADNGALYLSINGTWQNSGDPTSGASKTNAIDISGQSWYSDVTAWSLCIGDGSTSNKDSLEVSFGGCPAFSISSAQADDNGYGIFEYDVPAGYYSICTKNLAEYG